MNIYIRNGIPFLPASESKELVREQILSDIQDNFNLFSYVQTQYWDEQIQFFHLNIDYEDLLEIISDLNRLLLEDQLSYQYAEEIIDLFLEELDQDYNLNLADLDHISQECDINYEMIEMDDDVSDECIELFLKLR